MPNPRHRWLMLLLAILGTMMAALDTSIVNVAIPAMMKHFQSDVHEIEWIVTAYMVGFAAFMPLTAWLRVRFGIRRIYLGSLGVFVAGSVTCALAPSLGWLIGARILQSFAAGALTPTGMAIVSEVFEPKERGKALGYWGLGAVIGPALGPPLGGLLAEAHGWRAIFLVNVPIGIAALILAFKTLKKTHDAAHPSAKSKFDSVSFLSLTATIVGLMLFVNQGGELGWGQPIVLAYGAVAIVAGAVFSTSAYKTKRAVIDLSLFRYRPFAAAAIITAVRSFVLFGTTFMLPLYLQGPRGLGVKDSGMLLFPGAIAIALSMPISGRFFDRYGARVPAVIGILLMLVAMFQFSAMDQETNHFFIVLPTILRGIGIGLLVTPVAAVAMNSVPRGQEGMASSIANLIQQMAGSLGIALLSAFFNSQIERGGDDVAHSARSILAGVSDAGTAALAMDQVIAAFGSTYLFGALIVAAALLPIGWLPRRAPSS